MVWKKQKIILRKEIPIELRRLGMSSDSYEEDKLKISISIKPIKIEIIVNLLTVVSNKIDYINSNLNIIIFFPYKELYAH